MKNRAFTFLALLATVFLFAQCQKDETIHTTHFWTSKSTPEEQLTLFVDGALMGPLPYFSTNLTCSNDSLKAKAFQMTLKSGKYYLEAKDNQGEVRSSGTIKISESGMSSSGGLGDKGGMATSAVGPDNSCVIVDLFY